MNLAVVLVMLVLGWCVVSGVRRRGDIVAKRGMSIGADLGSLADKPRVCVHSVTKIGPDHVRLILAPQPSPGGNHEFATAGDLDLVVFLRDEEFGFELLHEWKQSESALAIVMPADSRIVRLRSIDDLQPLTLRRVDENKHPTDRARRPSTLRVVRTSRSAERRSLPALRRFHYSAQL